MKKIRIILMIGIPIILLLVFCNRKVVYPLSQSENTIEKIEIVSIEDSRIVSSGSFDRIVTISAIDENQYDDFLSEFYCLGCKDLFGPSQEVIEGDAIRFTYSDGSFELVTAESGFYYSADKEWSCPAYVFNYDEFHEFVYLWGREG